MSDSKTKIRDIQFWPMGIPDYQSLMLPLLKQTSDGPVETHETFYELSSRANGR